MKQKSLSRLKNHSSITFICEEFCIHSCAPALAADASPWCVIPAAASHPASIVSATQKATIVIIRSATDLSKQMSHSSYGFDITDARNDYNSRF